MKKTHQFKLAMFPLAISLAVLGGCSSSNNSTVERSGKAIDGYLANAKVCVDSNRNNVCDPDEPFAMTDGNGNYNLVTADTDAPLIVETSSDTTDSGTPDSDGAFDLASNRTVGEGLYMSAPNGATAISPLTTLAMIKAEVEGVSYADAQASVISELGLTGVTDLANYDFIAVLMGGSSEDERDQAFRATAIAFTVANVIQQNVAKIRDEAPNASLANVHALAVADLFDEDSSGSSRISRLAATINDTLDSGTSLITVEYLDSLASQNTILPVEISGDLETIADIRDDDGQPTGGTGGTGQ